MRFLRPGDGGGRRRDWKSGIIRCRLLYMEKNSNPTAEHKELINRNGKEHEKECVCDYNRIILQLNQLYFNKKKKKTNEEV